MACPMYTHFHALGFPISHSHSQDFHMGAAGEGRFIHHDSEHTEFTIHSRNTQNEVMVTSGVRGGPAFGLTPGGLWVLACLGGSKGLISYDILELM